MERAHARRGMQAHGMLEACAQAPSPEEVRKERIRAIAVLCRPSRARSRFRRANAERNRRCDGCGGSLQSLAAFHVAKSAIFGHETAFWHGLRAFASEGKPATWHFLDEKPLRLPNGGENRPDPCQNAVSWPKTGRLAARDGATCGETPSGALLGEEPSSKNRSGRRTRKPESAAALSPAERQANAALPRPRPRHQAKRAPSPQVRRRIARGDSSSANPPSPHADAFPRRAGAYPHRTPARAIPNAPSTHTRSQGAQPSTCGGGVPPRPTRRAKRRKRAKDGS